MQIEQPKYQQEYVTFINAYNKGVTSGEDVGFVIARLAQYYAETNLHYANALIFYNKIASTIEETSDSATGKPISSTKAKALASATPESNDLTIAKAHVENIDQMINALKSLQKGILNEWAHMGIS